jgi:anti-anti-sigma factor
VIAPRQSLLGGEVEVLRQRLGEALACRATRVVVDLRPAEYVSARALGVLVAHLSEMRERGGDLKLLGCRPDVRQLFDLCGLGAVFDFLDSEDDVAGSFEQEPSCRGRQELLGVAPREEGS